MVHTIRPLAKFDSHLSAICVASPSGRPRAGGPPEGWANALWPWGGFLPLPHPSGKGGIFLNGRAFWSWFLGIGARRPSPVIRDRHVPGFIFLNKIWGVPRIGPPVVGGSRPPPFFINLYAGSFGKDARGAMEEARRVGKEAGYTGGVYGISGGLGGREPSR